MFGPTSSFFRAWAPGLGCTPKTVSVYLLDFPILISLTGVIVLLRARERGTEPHPQGLTGQRPRLRSRGGKRSVLWESLLIIFSLLTYCPGEARKSPYRMAIAKVRKVSRPSGASSPSRDGASGIFSGGGSFGCLLRLLPLLGLALAVARGAGALAAHCRRPPVPVVAVVPYMGLMVLKGWACLSTHCSRACGFH